MYLEHFEHYDRLYWLLPLTMAVATGLFWLLNFRSRRTMRTAYADEKHMLRTSVRLGLTTRGEVIKLVGYNTLAILLSFCFAWPTAKRELESPGVGDLRLLAAFDVSGSMRADPYRLLMPTKTGAPPTGEHGTNLQMALNVHFNQVVKAAGHNQFALITFNTEAEEKTPFCEDVGAVSWLLRTQKMIEVGHAPGNGSDFISGLRGAAREIASDYDPSKRHFVVLYTDGGWKGDTVARQEAIDSLKALHVKLIVVGLGGKTPELVPKYLGERLVDYYPYGKEPKESAQLEEEQLKDLVKAYGPDAEYVPMDPGSLNKIDASTWRSKFNLKQPEESNEPLFEYLLLPAIFVWVLVLARGSGKNSLHAESTAKSSKK